MAENVTDDPHTTGDLEILLRAADAIRTDYSDPDESRFENAVADLLVAAYNSFNEAEVQLMHPWGDWACDCLSHREYRAYLKVARTYLEECT